MEDQIAHGVSALIAAGTTGEPSTMTWEEHLSVIRRVVEKADHRVPVIAGTGSNATSEAVYAARHAKEFGADARHVERAIRHVIDVAWRSGEMEAQYKIFGDTIDAKRGSPTCGEMIAQIADILRWEGRA